MQKSSACCKVQTIVCLAGWGFATLLAFIVLPLLYSRLILKLPSVQRADWYHVLQNKETEIASLQWKDKRPLLILAGDSHIEMGDWYALFGGAYATRNCGLSRATIQDVAVLVKSIPDAHPEAVILMCGINNIGRGDSINLCTKSYEKLLQATRTHLNPKTVIVLSVMPVRQSPVDQNSRRENETVIAFNEVLKVLSPRYNATFLNVNDKVTDSRGGLSEGLTFDGLHLNREGYKRIGNTVEHSLDMLQIGR
jgi:lysophospholipase L1-like esterase